MKDGYLRLHNPDPKELRVRYADSVVVLPASGSVVVSQLVGEALQSLYAHLEVTVASLEEYQAYRAGRDQLDVEEAKKSALLAAAATAASAEAAQAAVDRAKMVAAAEEAKALAAKEHHEKMVSEELLSIKTVDQTTARVVGTGSLPPTHMTDGMREAKATETPVS